MVQSDDADLDSLITQVQELFGGNLGQSAPEGQPSAPSVTPENITNSPSNFEAPLHDSWFNIGVFAPTGVNASHPHGHMGVDMSAPAGTPVYAFGPGVVTNVGTDPAGGNVVGVQHAGDIWSYYAHLSTITAHKGDKVDQNTVIATVGNTGNAGNKSSPLTTSENGRTWPHLHFGVKEHGNWVNPAKYFTIPAYNSDFARDPHKYQNFWLSNDAKEQALSFNIQQHNAEQKLAHSRNINKLLLFTHLFNKLVK